jgi:hypothetical protein
VDQNGLNLVNVIASYFCYDILLDCAHQERKLCTILTDAHPGLFFTSLSFLLPCPRPAVRAPLCLVLLALLIAIPGGIDSLRHDVQIHILRAVPQPIHLAHQWSHLSIHRDFQPGHPSEHTPDGAGMPTSDRSQL